jgi:hypothetical protein
LTSIYYEATFSNACVPQRLNVSVHDKPRRRQRRDGRNEQNSGLDWLSYYLHPSLGTRGGETGLVRISRNQTTSIKASFHPCHENSVISDVTEVGDVYRERERSGHLWDKNKEKCCHPLAYIFFPPKAVRRRGNLAAPSTLTNNALTATVRKCFSKHLVNH